MTKEKRKRYNVALQLCVGEYVGISDIIHDLDRALWDNSTFCYSNQIGRITEDSETRTLGATHIIDMDTCTAKMYTHVANQWNVEYMRTEMFLPELESFEAHCKLYERMGAEELTNEVRWDIESLADHFNLDNVVLNTIYYKDGKLDHRESATFHRQTYPRRGEE